MREVDAAVSSGRTIVRREGPSPLTQPLCRTFLIGTPAPFSAFALYGRSVRVAPVRTEFRKTPKTKSRGNNDAPRPLSRLRSARILALPLQGSAE
jgi:hypothetical protein